MPNGLYRRKGSDTWYALIYVNGERFRESTRTANKAVARAERENIRARIIADHRAKSRSPAVSWQNACVKWLAESERSLNDRYILRGLEYADRPLTACTPESFEPALEHLSKSTYNRYRSIIVAVCNLSGHKLKLPAKKVKNARLRFLTREEWERLHQALPAHLKPLAHFSILTGLRQANVTQLRWDTIDLKGGKMWIHAEDAKNEKPLGVPLSKAAVTLLRAQIGKSDEWVFPYAGRGRDAKKLGPMRKIKTAWQLAMERAGLGHFKRWKTPDGKKHKQWVGDFTWHGLRHTWASWHLMAGTPIEVLAKLGGWSDLRMVQKHYGHFASEHLAQFAANAVPWSRETATETSHKAA